ncbi:phosphotransferase [Luethyella okanaganae]|uniref:Phosphotransferase n=1 Tax=Luethyella okanaganae TaxID=69372 RepID=A0ABW1VAG7_9MICO
MARSHLTLAALATSAVPGLDVAAARSHTRGEHGDFDAAVLHGRDGHRLIVRVPRNQGAETEQSADLVALRALSTGVRSRLPFDVPEFLGQTPVGGTRAIVYGYLHGEKFQVDELTERVGLSGSIGRSIAAIHALPTAFITDAGLPQQNAQECRTAAIALIGQAADTGHVPAALLRRWEEATDDDALWRFPPTVIHGGLSADSFLVSDDAVSGILGWSGLRVGDAARDLHWLLGSRGEAAEIALAAYTAGRGGGADRLITQRAMLYAELELARWLMHGADTHNQAIIDDAVAMLDGLVESVHSDVMNPLSPSTGPVLAVSDVEAMLDRTPRAPLTRDHGSAMHTDSYDQSDFERSEFGDLDDADPDDDDTAHDDTAHDDTATGPIESGRQA